MTTAFITGLTGFSGRHLARFLRSQNIEVFGTSRSAVDEQGVIPLDLLDTSSIASTLDSIRPDYIFHLAASSHSADPAEFYKTNVLGSQSFFNAITSVPDYQPRVLSVGSCAEYGPITEAMLPITEDQPEQPITDYAISKLAQTKIALSHHWKDGLRVNVARVFNLVGVGMPDHLMIPTFARKIAEIAAGSESSQMDVGSIESTRDFVEITSACEMYWGIINLDTFGKVFNVCSGRPTRVGDILDFLVELSGATVDVVPGAFPPRAFDPPNHYGSLEKIINAGIEVKSDPEAINIALRDVFTEKLESID